MFRVGKHVDGDGSLEAERLHLVLFVGSAAKVENVPKVGAERIARDEEQAAD